MEKRELRQFRVDFRAAAGKRTVSGYAAVFDQPSEDFGGWREVIAPGAFDGVLASSDCRCLVNHDRNQVLGRTASKTLALSVDERGLKFECSMPDTQYARDLAACMERGDIDQCSFAFSVAMGGSKWEEQDKTTIRTITKISRLYDVSVVTYPAYPQTSADIRSHAEILSERPAPAELVGTGVDILRRRFALLID